MKNKMEELTVIVQGETAILSAAFEYGLLDRLKAPSLYKPALVTELGGLLSVAPPEQNTLWKDFTEKQLALYVANTNTYQLIRKCNFHTLVVTVFEVCGPGKGGYQFRVAGTMSESFNEFNITVDDKPVHDKLHYTTLCFLQGSLNMYSEEYTVHSNFHALKAEAIKLHGRIHFNPVQLNQSEGEPGV